MAIKALYEIKSLVPSIPDGEYRTYKRVEFFEDDVERLKHEEDYKRIYGRWSESRLISTFLIDRKPNIVFARKIPTKIGTIFHTGEFNKPDAKIERYKIISTDTLYDCSSSGEYSYMTYIVRNLDTKKIEFIRLCTDSHIDLVSKNPNPKSRKSRKVD